MSALRAIVVGGGIGGLTTAIAFARKGIRVTLLEQAGELGEIGAGIQLSPNATRVLFAFGLERALGGVAFRPEAVEARTWRLGVLISHVPLGAAVVAQFGLPYLHVHRADLIALLARAAAEHPLVGADCLIVRRPREATRRARRAASRRPVRPRRPPPRLV